MEQQSFRAQRLESLGTLAGGIAHDLNNVLAPILLAVGLLQIEEADPERREVLNTIEASATRGAAMVTQVLSFARGVEGRRAVVDPSTVIGDVVRIMRDTFPKAIHVESRPGPVLWPLRADATQLHQVLLNLCVNARDAMADGGCIAITAENVQIDAQYAALHLGARVGSHVAIEVSDTGPGIPAGIIDKIFDPFFTTKEIGKGTGLGLATSLTIMKGHGGFIRVHSDPGAGTRFRLFLPAEPGTEEQRLEAPAPLLSRGNGQIVLLVDDEASIRQINKQTLEAYGYRVLLAEDGAAAIAIYGEHCRDVAVVITDMMMPLMGGLTLSGILQGMNPRVRIIGASGLAEAATVAAAAAAGVGQFLAKPYTAEALLTAVSAALAEPS
jgi:CheY-like chemotaxis protein